MTDLNARADSFISMVMSVNGRVRPADLISVPESERLAVLSAYEQAHGSSQPLHFDGETLVAGTAVPTPAYGAPTPVEPGPIAPESFSPSRPIAAEPTLAPPASQPTVVPAEVASVAADAPVMPIPDDAPPLSPTEAAIEPVAETPAAGKVAWVMWLLPVFLTWVGGIIAWALVKKENPRHARTLLISGITLTFVYGALLFAMFGGVVGALFNSSPLNEKLPAIPPKTAYATSTPAPSAPASAPSKK